MLCVVSVVDSISVTSMPINEFVIYRSMHNYPIKQAVIVCDKDIPDNVQIPQNVQVYLTGSDRKKIKEVVKQIMIDNIHAKIVFHAHHQKSALIFFTATVGMNIRKHILYTVHSTYSARDLKYKISSCLCALIAKKVNCVSESAYKEYNFFIKRIKGKDFLSIPNGVDVDRIDKAIQNNPATSGRKTLICVGRMIPLKNHEFLIYLMQKLPDYKLILIGAEDKERKIRRLAKELDVFDRVEFTGLISRDDVFRKLNSASIYLSSSYIEGLPVSVLEAMRVGLLPIISNIEPHKEIANRCKHVEVMPLDLDLWATAIEGYSKIEQSEIDLKSSEIKISVKEMFSLEKMHSDYLTVYESLS